MNSGKIRVLGYNLSEVCHYCMLSSPDNSAVSVGLALIQSAKDLFCLVDLREQFAVQFLRWIF